MEKSTARSRQPDSLAQAFLWALLPTLVLFLIAPSLGDAQVVTTNITQTTGTGNLGTQVLPLSGNVYGITGGKTLGTNLFHSFGEFSVGAGDIAQFQTSNLIANPSMSNILGRVTGGNPSSIFGAIDSATYYPTANLFLMNPFGIVFGATATLNVGGSVSFTNAQYIRLFDGISSANFYADPAKDVLTNSILTIDSSAFTFLNASPAAYGFLTAPGPNATITVQGSALSVPSGQSISLVGGNISIGADPSTGTPAVLSVPGGQINLGSVASAGEVSAANFMPTSGMTMGSISLSQGTTLDVSGGVVGNPIGDGHSGTVFVRGGQLVMDASKILANTVGAVDGASTAVDVEVSQDVTLSNVAVISTGTSGLGRAGDVHITANSLTLENASGIIMKTQTGNGEGGDLLLNVRKLSLLGGLEFGPSLIQSANSNVGSGKGGNVTIQGISHEAGSVADEVVLSGGSQILSFTQASGAGGQISITATSLNLSGSDIFDHGLVSTIGSSTTGTGHGGDIVARVQQLQVLDGATISSHSVRGSSSDPSAPTAGAGGMVTVQGLAGSGSKADSVRLSGKSTGIFSDSVSGLPGDITVNAGNLTITNGAAISAGSAQITGRAGQVAVTADSIVISAGGQIFSQSFAQDAGQVTIKANQLTLDNGSIVTKTSSPIGGHGGNVVLNVGSASLTNGATIDSSSDGTGNAGRISIKAGTLGMGNGATITSSSTESATGTAGSITIQGLASPADSVTITDSSLLTTAANTGQGGSISVNATNLTLKNATISASVKDFNAADPNDGAAVGTGNIGLSAHTMTMTNNSKVTTESSGSRNAGDILINRPDAPGNSFEMQSSTINTSAALADGGNIGIHVTNMVRLIDSTITSSVGNKTKTDTLGGNVTIDPQFVILQNSQIRANAFAGAGGAITITSNVFLADPTSVVDASSTLGVSGTVDIRSPVSNISGILGRLPESVLAAQALLRAACAARLAESQVSSFVERGRDSIPIGPDGLLATPYLPPSSEPSSQMGAVPVDSGRESKGESFRTSGVQVRRLVGADSIPRVQLLSGDAACGS